MALTATYGALNLTAAPYMLEFGSDYGGPQNVTDVLALMLQDGEVELTDRLSNRTIQFNVLIEGANLGVIATSEAALTAEAAKPMNTLTIDPGDSGPATVFETFRGQVVWQRDDNMDMQRLRRYAVTIKALPAGRSASEVTAAALPASGTTTTLVDNGSATTNWTGTVNGTPTSPAVVSGAVKVTSAALTGTITVSETRTASITTSSTKWLVVDWKPETPADGQTLLAFGDGIALRQDAQIGLPSGLLRTWFFVAASSVAALRLDSTTTGAAGLLGTGTATVRSLAVDNIDRTDIRPTNGTARQLQRSIDVAGSARTQGSLTIEHSTNALGDVLVYVWPSEGTAAAYSPSLRQYRVAGGATVTADANLVSGSRDALGPPGTTTWDIPLAALSDGNHTFMVRVDATLGALSTAMSLTWTATTRINGTTVGSTYTATRSLTNTSGYVILALDRLSLPTVDVDLNSTTAVVRITITSSFVAGAAPTINLDEAWLFNTRIGQLIQVACGTGTAASGGPAKRLFIEPATAARPRPVVRIGHAADGSDAYYPAGSALSSWQFPEFKPPRVKVHTVTTNALDASVTLRHYPRWELNAAS